MQEMNDPTSLMGRILVGCVSADSQQIRLAFLLLLLLLLATAGLVCRDSQPRCFANRRERVWKETGRRHFLCGGSICVAAATGSAGGNVLAECVTTMKASSSGQSVPAGRARREAKNHNKLEAEASETTEASTKNRFRRQNPTPNVHLKYKNVLQKSEILSSVGNKR